MADANRQKHSKSKIGKKAKKTDEKPVVDFSGIENVEKITLSTPTQEVLQCVVGQHVTGESPWLYISITKLEDALECEEGCRDLKRVQTHIQDKENQTSFLLYYAEDEMANFDEFYICTSVQSQTEVEKIMTKTQNEQNDKLNGAIVKYAKPWLSQGSEEPIDDELKGKNRPLLQVELETQYPIFKAKTRFKLSMVQDRIDSYIAKDGERFPMNAVYPVKVDSYVQARPMTKDNGVQTDYKFPKHIWTQYEYEYKSIEEPTPSFVSNFNAFAENELDNLCNELNVNGALNLYTKDYEDLVINAEFTKPAKISQATEYMSFAEARLCKDKMISAITWHPFYTGVFAVAYCDYTITKHIGESPPDETNRIIFNSNPVLVWSFVDSLKPKLILDSPSEVNALSFCPHDSSLIVGGCRNGRIILWDIRNKLQQAEEEDLLKPSIQRYRKLLYSVMGWIKNVRNVGVVAPTAISDHKFSHKCPVSQVEWISPFHEISEVGIIKEISEKCETFTLQFVSCSDDGKLLFWDLKSNHSISVEDVFSERPLKRLKKRPPALTPEMSLYSSLNGILKPLYTLNMFCSSEEDSPPALVSSFSLPYFTLNYEETIPNAKRKFSTITRLLYKPVLKRHTKLIEQKVCVGTYDGQFTSSTWDGYPEEKFEEDERKNFETAQLSIIAKYHDGPVVSISRWSEQPDILLSVGGKIFCIWKESLIRKPLMWRRSRVRYTHGCWALNKLRLTRSDGSMELWDFLVKSHEPSFEQSLSGKLLSGTSVQAINQSIIGIGDHNGIFRLFNSMQTKPSDKETVALKEWFNKQVDIQKQALSMQDAWDRKFAAKMAKIWQEEAEMKKLREHQQRIARKRKKEEDEVRAKEEAREAARLSKPPPGKLAEFCQGKWIEREKHRINREILQLKQLEPALLRELQQPLVDINKANAEKKHKKILKSKQSHSIFESTIDMHFPYVHAPKSPPPKNPYGCSNITSEQTEEVLRNYKEVTKDLQVFIEGHPFNYTFDWHTLMKSGVERSEMMHSTSGKFAHKDRHQRRMVERKLAAEKAVEAKKMATRAMKKAGRSTSRILKDAVVSSVNIKRLTSKSSLGEKK